jgi:hypothetical protein
MGREARVTRPGPRLALPEGMAWKTTIPWFGAVATFAAGYVWVRWARGQRGASPHGSQSATLLSELDEIAEDDLLPIEVDLEDLAREDALRALEAQMLEARAPEPSSPPEVPEEWHEVELDPSDWEDSELTGPSSGMKTADSTEQLHPGDEPYDAVDAEDMGTAWLRRATQMEPFEESDPNDVWGTQVIEPPELDASRREAAYGRDREGTSLAPNAGTHEDDVAAELPVGTLDDSGNAELHAPVNPPDAFDAPPTGSLSPTEQEILRRAAAEVQRLRSRR